MYQSSQKPILLFAATILILALAFAVLLLRVFGGTGGQGTTVGSAENTPTAEAIEATRDRQAGNVQTTPTPLEDARGLARGRIAYVTPDEEVATISPAGDQQRTLTENGIRFQFPAWSGDGQFLAAIGSRQGGAGVYLLKDQASSSELQELYFSRSQAPFYLYWAPDNQKIAFLANHSTEVLGLHIVPVLPEHADQLLATGSPFYWQWTADAQQLFIHTGYSGPGARLELLDVTGGEDGLSVARPGFFQTPGISPSGRYLAYAEEVNDEASQLVIADTQSESLQKERHPGQVAFGWSPRDDLLAVISEETGAGHFYGPLRLVDARTGEVRLLTRDTVIAFFWSPDGGHIAAFALHGRSDDVQAMALDPKLFHDAAPKAQNGSESSRAKFAQQLQIPELGAFVIDVATGATRLLRTFQPSQAFATQFLPFFDQYALSHQIWSPDSVALVVPTEMDGHNGILILPIDGEEPRQLADGDMPFWSRQ